jgi:hypothetical protein
MDWMELIRVSLINGLIGSVGATTAFVVVAVIARWH